MVKRTGDAESYVFYDGWNLEEEHCVSGGLTNVSRYYWGKNFPGTFRDSGGIGGLLFFIRNDDRFIPFCDANGYAMAKPS